MATPTLGSPAPEANSKLLFASFGDMPYMVPTVNYRQGGQEAEDRLVLRRLIEPTLKRRRDIPFLIHMGDIGRVEDACTRPWQKETLLEWNRIGKPLVVIPGDNDWVDCGRLGVQPLERLKEIRETFYSGNQFTTINGTTFNTSVLTGERGLCTSGIPELTCEAKPPESTPEMVRWSYRNVAFAAIHHTSSNNGWVKNDLSRQAETGARGAGADHNPAQKRGGGGGHTSGSVHRAMQRALCGDLRVRTEIGTESARASPSGSWRHECLLPGSTHR
jgi:hypothetical protein